MTRPDNIFYLLRKKKGLTIKELEPYLPVSLTTYQKWERDTGYPDPDSLQKLMDFYEVYQYDRPRIILKVYGRELTEEVQKHYEQMMISGNGFQDDYFRSALYPDHFEDGISFFPEMLPFINILYQQTQILEIIYRYIKRKYVEGKEIPIWNMETAVIMDFTALSYGIHLGAVKTRISQYAANHLIEADFEYNLIGDCTDFMRAYFQRYKDRASFEIDHLPADSPAELVIEAAERMKNDARKYRSCLHQFFSHYETHGMTYNQPSTRRYYIDTGGILFESYMVRELYTKYLFLPLNCDFKYILETQKVYFAHYSYFERLPFLYIAGKGYTKNELDLSEKILLTRYKSNSGHEIMSDEEYVNKCHQSKELNDYIAKRQNKDSTEASKNST